MRKKNWISLTVLSVLIVAGFIVLQATTSSKKVKEPVKKQEQTICSSIKTQECNPAKKAEGPGEMLMESLSRQFLSISIFSR